MNADPKELPKLCLLSKGNLHLTADRLIEEEVSENAVNELKGGIARIIKECKESIWTKYPEKETAILPTPSQDRSYYSSDKSKRRIALDNLHYQNMLNNSTIETDNYEEIKKLNLPRTEQINVNGKLNKVANK